MSLYVSLRSAQLHREVFAVLRSPSRRELGIVAGVRRIGGG